MISIVRQSIARHPVLWWSITIGFILVYHAAMFATITLRFGALPNYVTGYDLFANYRLILDGTPSLMDAIPIMLQEAVFETGYRNPDYYGIAEWSFMVLPAKLLMILLAGALLATSVALWLAGRENTPRACRSNHGPAFLSAPIAGTSLLGLVNATLTWVVCCATPSWVVLLAVLGVNSSLALSLEPLGMVLSLIALAFMCLLIVWEARRLQLDSRRITNGLKA